MTRLTVVEASLLAIGFVIGVACSDSNAHEVPLSTANGQGAGPRSFASLRMTSVRDDTAAVARLLAVVRGGDPLVCELATRAADMHGHWSMWGPMSGDPLTVDSTAAELLDWIQRKHDDAALVPRLQAAMRDPDACVRRIAGSLLGRVSHPSAERALLTALDDPSAGTREVAAFGLGMGESPTAVAPLVARLRDPSAPVRRAAAWALGQLEDRKAVAPLIETLRDSDPRVRQTAAWAIGSIH